MSQRIFYAIGDVHGERDLLVALHDAIDEHWKREGGGRPATVVHIGDYVDRGPDSRGVVEHLIGLQRMPEKRPEIDIVCLMGNHERLMLDAMATGEHATVVNWLLNGGEATVESYRRAAPPNTPLQELAPKEHIDWMTALPTRIIDREAGLVFVHAGVQPKKFPDCKDEVRLWTRAQDFMNDAKWPKNKQLDGLMVVHGHTPTNDAEPYAGPRRVNIDTGACYGGPLTAAVFKDGAPPTFLYARK
jgi:serine/threonine protein phosphatase 1